MKELQSFGAAGEVTGSCHVLTDNHDNRILVDFGMFQGSKDKERLNATPPDFDASELQGVALTHGHADHAARLPLLSKMGYEGSIYATPPTRDLAQLILADSANIMQKEYQFGGRMPLYDRDDVSRTMEMFKTVDYGEQFNIGGFRGTFRNAGHILGSASLELREQKVPYPETIVFSGDLGNDNPDDIIRSKELIDQADIVVMETTYGDKNHEVENTDEVIKEELERIQRNGGTLLIPAFSIAKTQRMLDIIKRIKHENKVLLSDKDNKGKVTDITKLRVYLDSPMGARATRIYSHYQDELSDRIRGGKDDPFSFNGLVIPHTPEERNLIDTRRGAKVIIAGAGMMNGGRIRHYARNYLSRESTGILFTGYQAEASLGRQILEGEKVVEIDGEAVEVNAHIAKVGNLSSHAGQQKLMEWLEYPEGVRQAVLVHGDNMQRETFSRKVQSEYGIPTVLPRRGEIVNLQPSAMAAD